MANQDPLQKGKVSTSSVGFPAELWKAIDEEVELEGWKSRSAFLTAIVAEAMHDLRAQRAKARLAELEAAAAGRK